MSLSVAPRVAGVERACVFVQWSPYVGMFCGIMSSLDWTLLRCSENHTFSGSRLSSHARVHGMPRGLKTK